MVKSSGNTAALSHTFSTLSVCSMVADCDEYSVTLSRHPPEVTARAPVESETCIGPIDDGKQRKRRREPWTYDTSVETAQKRAYATNSYRILLSEVLPVKRDHRRDRQERAADEGTSFIAKMASLAISDVVVLVRGRQTKHALRFAQSRVGNQYISRLNLTWIALGVLHYIVKCCFDSDTSVCIVMTSSMDQPVRLPILLVVS